jgi:hypothetical protein
VVPFGTIEQDIYFILDATGIGKDTFSSYHRLNSPPFNNPTSVVCVVHYDHRTLGLIKKSYLIYFQIDQDKRLADVDVKEALTGP